MSVGRFRECSTQPAFCEMFHREAAEGLYKVAGSEREALRSRGRDAIEKLRAGPGTELKALLASLGITEFTGCDCASKAAEMDRNGVQWCREHRAEIIGWLADAQQKAGWLATLKAAATAAINGVWLDPRDPLGSLVDRAIEQAERKALEKSRVEESP